jgi:hypothetical protein
VQRPCDILQAYAVDAAGTQGGLLPVLSEPLPQFGPLPSRRTYHRCVCLCLCVCVCVCGGGWRVLSSVQQ